MCVCARACVCVCVCIHFILIMKSVQCMYMCILVIKRKGLPRVGKFLWIKNPQKLHPSSHPVLPKPAPLGLHFQSCVCVANNIKHLGGYQVLTSRVL